MKTAKCKMTTSVFTKSAEGDTEGCGWVRDNFKLDELVKSMIKGKITKYVHKLDCLLCRRENYSK